MHTVLEAAPHAIMLVDGQGGLRTMNAVAARMFGVEPQHLAAARMSDLLPMFEARGGAIAWAKSCTGAAASADAVQAPSSSAREAGSAADACLVNLDQRHRVTGVTADGREFPLIAVIGKAGEGAERLFSVFVVDLSDRAALDREVEALRDELIHAGRVGAMSEMTSTIAHEIAQPLTAAKNYLFAAKIAMRRDPAMNTQGLADLMAKADAEIDRASGIITNLRHFMRKGGSARGAHPLNDVVHEAALLALTGSARHSIEAGFQLDPAVPQLTIDKVQIQQVIVNLVRNAVDALISGASARRIDIATRREGDMALIEVRDTGPGIAPGTLARLFQPFTTTKEQGMGLGLSISRRIIEAHGGDISADNRDEGGAVFRVRLPLENCEA